VSPANAGLFYAPGYNPAMLIRICLFVALLSFTSGCSHHKSRHQSQPDKPAAQQVQDDKLHYDDPRLWGNDLQAVRAATALMLDPKLPRPDLDKTFRYELWKDGEGWYIGVWRIVGFDGNQPRLSPEGATWIAVDKDFHAKMAPNR
jgi:hypothetical protein